MTKAYRFSEIVGYNQMSIDVFDVMVDTRAVILVLMFSYGDSGSTEVSSGMSLSLGDANRRKLCLHLSEVMSFM